MGVKGLLQTAGPAETSLTYTIAARVWEGALTPNVGGQRFSINIWPSGTSLTNSFTTRALGGGSLLLWWETFSIKANFPASSTHHHFIIVPIPSPHILH